VTENTLDELYSRDPLSLTSDDFKALVVQLRKDREEFIASGEDAKAAARNRAKSKGANPNLSLKDLGL
jgi:hypothetical protein